MSGIIITERKQPLSIAKTNLLGLDRKELADIISDKPFRGEQAFQWLYQKGARQIDEMTNISLPLRKKISEVAYIGYPEICSHQISSDGTEKFAYRLDDGEVIESVLIPDEENFTICVSSQAGCAMGCDFCCTATLGFTRNLIVAEILSQVLMPIRLYPEKVFRNIVLMGMGEPLLNYENVLKAVKILSDKMGPDFSTRRITISTCGIVPKLPNLWQEMGIGIAISLNAATDEKRSAIMPVNKKYPLAELKKALLAIELPPRRTITVEYVMLGGFNDTTSDARALVGFLHGIRSKINLIPFNPWPGASFEAPAEDAISAFQEYLKTRHFSAVIRKERGTDIMAACGQLAGGKI
jgi:23S rRNA (adenine2503-C2)-methyltransferase